MGSALSLGARLVWSETRVHRGFAQLAVRPRNGTGIQASARPESGSPADSTDVRQATATAACSPTKQAPDPCIPMPEPASINRRELCSLRAFLSAPFSICRDWRLCCYEIFNFRRLNAASKWLNAALKCSALYFSSDSTDLYIGSIA